MAVVEENEREQAEGVTRGAEEATETPPTMDQFFTALTIFQQLMFAEKTPEFFDSLPSSKGEEKLQRMVNTAAALYTSYQLKASPGSDVNYVPIRLGIASGWIDLSAVESFMKMKIEETGLDEEKISRWATGCREYLAGFVKE